MTPISNTQLPYLLRFITVGSVDDGKSTLVGRLLVDTHSLHNDTLINLKQLSKLREDASLNLALVTDGLRDEREHGITIDVAYRYFSTHRRKFILADAPGHFQYTRNMITGASTASLALLLVDARHGLTEQSRRHILLLSLLKIRHLVLCVNKMDLVNWAESAFTEIVRSFNSFTSELGISHLTFIPISALHGDNIVTSSPNSPWYSERTVLDILETVDVTDDAKTADARLPIQCVIRPHNSSFRDYRGYAGRIASGTFKVGDNVTILPSHFTTRIKSICSPAGYAKEANSRMSVVISISEDADISRGDLIFHPNSPPCTSQDLGAIVCWFSSKTFDPSRQLLIRHTTREVRCAIRDVHYKIDTENLQRKYDDLTIGVNDIAYVTFHTAVPLHYDEYEMNRITGSFIVIDEQSNETVAAGIISADHLLKKNPTHLPQHRSTKSMKEVDNNISASPRGKAD